MCYQIYCLCRYQRNKEKSHFSLVTQFNQNHPISISMHSVIAISNFALIISIDGYLGISITLKHVCAEGNFSGESEINLTKIFGTFIFEYEYWFVANLKNFLIIAWSYLPKIVSTKFFSCWSAPSNTKLSMISLGSISFELHTNLINPPLRNSGFEIS